MTLAWYLAKRVLRALAAALAALVLLVLAVELAENAGRFRGPGWAAAVLALYAHRAAAVAWEAAPAALLAAAAVAASGVRRDLEDVALRAAGLGPWRVAAPALAVAAALAAALVACHDAVVVGPSARADAILAGRFGGGAAPAAEGARWLRGRDGRRLYRLGPPGAGGFAGATVLELGDGARLERRIDAEWMRPGPGSSWLLEGVVERTYRADGAELARADAERTLDLGEDPRALSLRAARPAHLRRAELGEQLALRRELGLPARDLAVERQRRLAHPASALPAALLATGLALRRGRRGSLALALLEAGAASAACWAVQAAAWALALAGRLDPAAAAWASAALLLAAGLAAMRRAG